VGREVDGARSALGFGTDVSHLPRRPALFHHRHDPVSGLRDPPGIRNAREVLGGCERAAGHCRDGVMAAEDSSSVIQPGGTLFGVRARFVFGVASLQRCLLGEVESTAVGGRPRPV
jgi:hypothetical protein